MHPHGQCSGFVFQSGPSDLAFLNRPPSFSLGRTPCSLGQSATLGEERWPLTQPRQLSLSPQELQRYVWPKLWVKKYGLGVHTINEKVVTMEKSRQAIVWVIQSEFCMYRKSQHLYSLRLQLFLSMSISEIIHFHKWEKNLRIIVLM